MQQTKNLSVYNVNPEIILAKGLDAMTKSCEALTAQNERLNKDIENLKKTGQEVPKKLIGRAGTSPTAGRNIRSKQFIGKKMNMGGVMKNRGGTFKGVF